uniref:Uncharacterized protein n=1 Tax=Ascaris lumbricoides TaxID=6252 RepID=A0A0M3HX19_ASCLU
MIARYDLIATIAYPKRFFVVVSMWPTNWKSSEIQNHLHSYLNDSLAYTLIGCYAKRSAKRR